MYRWNRCLEEILFPRGVGVFFSFWLFVQQQKKKKRLLFYTFSTLTIHLPKRFSWRRRLFFIYIRVHIKILCWQWNKCFHRGVFIFKQPSCLCTTHIDRSKLETPQIRLEPRNTAVSMTISQPTLISHREHSGTAFGN